MPTLEPYNYPDYRNLPPQFPPDYASAWGEDQHGIWFDLLLEGVTQRFRWIPLGTFMMGSPDGEIERYSDESLYEVTFTQGFWLADTACTQELWQTVMKDNPSDFKVNLQNPVETVSWIDCQEFLTKLNQTIPGLKAHMPTEAQWEYACRAGTITPFSFGDNISPEQVNYDGDNPYADGRKGEDRGKTVAVKALSANQWGLYQMHGNVWEWCFDEFQVDLGKTPVSDPVHASYMSRIELTKEGFDTKGYTAKSDNKALKTGLYDAALLVNADDGDVERVLRGRSWCSSGRFCRSAIRLRCGASLRFNFFGFRFALGH